LAWGTALVVVPGWVLRVIGAGDTGPTPRRIVRVLGARHLLQAVTEVAGGDRARGAGVAVDAIHGATDVAFGCVAPRWRRAAFTDAAITFGFAKFAVIGIGETTGPLRG
jgi:hypothetical protein